MLNFRNIAIVGGVILAGASVWSAVAATPPVDPVELKMRVMAQGTMLYVTDYDDLFPYAQSTPTAIYCLLPYMTPGSLAQTETDLDAKDWFEQRAQDPDMQPQVAYKNLKWAASRAQFARSEKPAVSFAYNLNIGGVMMTSIAENAAQIPTWYERNSNANAPVWVALANGRVIRAEREPLRAALKRSFPRPKDSHPLPARHGLSWVPRDLGGTMSDLP